MPIAQQMLGLPTDPNAGVGAMKGQILVKPVKIISIRRAPPPVTPAPVTPAPVAPAPATPTPSA